MRKGVWCALCVHGCSCCCCLQVLPKECLEPNQTCSMRNCLWFLGPHHERVHSCSVYCDVAAAATAAVAAYKSAAYKSAPHCFVCITFGVGVSLQDLGFDQPLSGGHGLSGRGPRLSRAWPIGNASWYLGMCLLRDYMELSQEVVGQKFHVFKVKQDSTLKTFPCRALFSEPSHYENPAVVIRIGPVTFGPLQV